MTTLKLKYPVTTFWDYHSGGFSKVKDFEFIIIEAEQEKAEKIFYYKFGINPHMISCTCCGNDFGIDEVKSESDIKFFEERMGKYKYYIVGINQIKLLEKKHPNMYDDDLPDMGYVWK